MFVPFTLPGELVEAAVIEDKSGYANAELAAARGFSADRRPAPCPYFGECGGCHYQHADYAAQLGMKAEILRETLERAHLADIPRDLRSDRARRLDTGTVFACMWIGRRRCCATRDADRMRIWR